METDFSRLMVIQTKTEKKMEQFKQDLDATQSWFDDPRFAETRRLYTAEQVVEQRGTIPVDYSIARMAADGLYARLRELFSEGKTITTFGPYSPGQAVVIKRMGIEAIYLGGWATSAKGSATEDPGPDLASYPLSQVPDEAAALVRALIAADRNQQFARQRMPESQRKTTSEVDYRPFIIADADTGHGGESHVRNLIRRFVEAGVPGYHIEDQKPGVKKCGHQAGKVLVPQDEQIRRLNSARFQLDIMNVAGIIVARTDAEAATFLDGGGDERDHPFILGATNVEMPSYKVSNAAILKRFHDKDVEEINGHLLFHISESSYDEAYRWLDKVGLLTLVDNAIKTLKQSKDGSAESTLNEVIAKFLDIWQMEAALKTYGQAVADAMRFHLDEGGEFDMSLEEWNDFVGTASFSEARERARSMGVNIIWDRELARTPEGYYQIQGGIEYAVAKSLAASPYADILWMETKTANLEDARTFAEAIHNVYPDKMMAYNLSPSFNWDTTGMTDVEMKNFPTELGKLGFVFNFITYGGHQIDGMAAEEFATALMEDGMLALARLQRKMRLVDSPYSTPQSYVGGPRSDAGLMASTGRTATTNAMGKGSTHFQHLIQTEVPPRLLESWLQKWTAHYDVEDTFHVNLRPHTAGSELLSLQITGNSKEKLAEVVFATIQDRRERTILSVRDQNTFSEEYRQKRLMTLLHLFLVHRYRAVSVHYVSPTEDNLKQTSGMQALGIYAEVHTEVGQIIVAGVNEEKVRELLDTDEKALTKLITKVS
jgi:isocitrate lyase